MSISKGLKYVLELGDLERINIAMVDDSGRVAGEVQNGFDERNSDLVCSRLL